MSTPDETEEGDGRPPVHHVRTWIAIGLVAVGTALAVWWIRSGDAPPPAAPYVSRPPGGAARPATASITQIMIMYDQDRGGAKARLTKAQAREICQGLIARIRKGESMESLLNEYTDDRGPDGKPFNRGDFTITAKSPAVAAIKKAAFETPVGQLAPEPVDSGFAYHVVRRDL